MPGVWNAMRLNHDDESVVVVPSISLDRAVSASGSMSQAYEERFLFLLVLLRQPRLRMVYVTSMPIAPEIVEYYLALLSGVIPSHARARLSLISVNDASARSLSEKLLARPRLLRRIADLVPNPARSHMVPYNTTELERDVALSIGIPMYGADPRLAELGSKTGCRRLFAEVGVPHPLGRREPAQPRRDRRRPGRDAAGTPVHGQRHRQAQRGCLGVGERRRDPDRAAEPGFAGREGRGDDAPPAAWTWRQSPHRSRSTSPSSPRAGGSSRSASRGQELQSPSVQLRVLPSGEVELLSTHDQLLGGPSGQKYLGCVFPAAAAYARLITGHAEQIGQRLAREGALGRFAVDFVVVRDSGGSWTPYAIELNLRRGGTTHPFLTLQFLTDGRYDPATALFTTPRGREKHLVATDHLESPDLRGLAPADLFDIVARHGLHFDQSRQEGIVFHMISCLTEHGRLGMTAVGDTPRGGGPPLPRGREDPPRRGPAGARGAATPCLTRSRRRTTPSRRRSRSSSARLTGNPRPAGPCSPGGCSRRQAQLRLTRRLSDPPQLAELREETGVGGEPEQAPSHQQEQTQPADDEQEP